MNSQSHDKEYVLTEEITKTNEQEQVVPANQTSQIHDERAEDQSVSSSERANSDQDKNWKEVRHIMKEQRSQIENLERELSRFKEPAKQEVDPFENLSEDDVVTVADMKKYAAKVAKDTAQNLYEQRSRQQEIETTPSRYNDYYDVIQYVEPLIKENPALLSAIENSANPREAAYQAAKLYLKGKDPNQSSAKKIEENLNKPKPSDSISVGGGLHTGGRRSLSLEDKAKIFEQAQQYASMR